MILSLKPFIAHLACCPSHIESYFGMVDILFIWIHGSILLNLKAVLIRDHVVILLFPCLWVGLNNLFQCVSEVRFVLIKQQGIHFIVNAKLQQFLSNKRSRCLISWRWTSNLLDLGGCFAIGAIIIVIEYLVKVVVCQQMVGVLILELVVEESNYFLFILSISFYPFKSFKNSWNI